MKVAFLVVLLIAAACANPSRLSETIKSKLSHRTPAETNPFIINGTTTGEAAAPHLVSFSASRLVYAHICSGVIISKEWVLTPAHCITELKKLAGKVEGLSVYAGLTDRNNRTDAQVRKIGFAFSHKGFTGAIGSDDIALVHVNPHFEFNEKVNQVHLPYKNEVFDGETAVVYGWGLDDPQGTLYGHNLQMVKSDVLSRHECKNLLPIHASFNKKHVCVAISACNGDGGAPLVIERPGGTVELIGLASYGFLPCGYNNHPTIFTDVASYRHWISDVQSAYYILH